MEKKVDILGIEVNNYSAHEAMQKVVTYFENDSMNVINTIYPTVLMAAQKDPELKAGIEAADLTIIGDKAILSAADITDEKRCEEVANSVFLSLFLHFIGAQGHPVHLLSEKEKVNEEILEYFSEYYDNLNIVGASVVAPDEEQDDRVVNEINSTDAAVLFSTLTSPHQEFFISRNKTRINVNVWFGIGESNYIMNARTGLFKRLIDLGIFKRQVSKQKNKEEI